MIDTQGIRSKILDLAMHGKLTEQLPEDGTAEGLVATSANTKTTRMLATPFEIPNSWRWTSVEKLTTPIGKKSDQIYANDVKNTGKYPAVSQGEQFIDGYTDEEKAIVDLPVIIFGDHTKNVKFVDFPFVICADGTKCLKVSSLNDPKFVFFWMKYASGAIEDRGYARHYSLLKKYPVSLPPLAEQHRIVARIEQAFSALDTIDALQAKYADNLAVLKSKLIVAAIQGKLTEQLPEDGTAEELYRQIQAERKRQESAGTIKTVELAPCVQETDKPFEIPSNWKWTSLGNVSYIVRGGSPRPIKQYITTREDGINWIKIGDVEKGGKYIFSTHEKIIPEGESKSRRVYPGDFLLTNSMSFGRPYISKIEGCIHDGWLLIHDLTGFDPDYLYYLLSSSYLYGQFTVKASGSTVDNLNIDKVKAALVPLPPLAEQKRIVAKLEELLPLCDEMRKV